MELEVFLVSTVYWISILTVGIWLHRRLSSLERKLVNLQAEGANDEN